jgi:hypothetical protein
MFFFNAFGSGGTAMRSPRKRILILTNAKHGRTDVFVAVSHALGQLGAEVHFASFSDNEELVKSQVADIQFHSIHGAQPQDDTVMNLTEGRQPWFFNMPRFLWACLRAAMPWTGPQYVEIYRSVVQILQSVKPDVVAIDPAFAPAITACHHMGDKCVILSPDTIKDFAITFQPMKDIFGKYPW